METFDQSFNIWMHPAGVVNSAEVVSARKIVVASLKAAGIDDYYLVLAAFGEVDDSVKGTVERRLQEEDPTYAPGKKHLVELICGSAVMLAMEGADARAVDVALLVQSALFRGLKPRIKSTSESADVVMAVAASRSRARISPKRVSARVQAAESPDGVDAAAVSALATRLEYAVGHFDSQLQFLNEEVDVLWWARSGRSASGTPWADLTDLQRAVHGTAEMSKLVIELPVTGAVFEVLREVVAAPKRKTESFRDICDAASDAIQLPTITSSRWLLPLLSGIRISRAYPADSRAGVTATELGFDADFSVRIVDVPEQLLRELAILARVS